jgi:hypothetical protein
LAVQKLIGQIRQLRPLSFLQPDVGVKFVVLDLVDQHGKAVALCVEIRGVDLVDVPGEDDLGVFAGTGDDGLHFVGCQVLRFVHDETDI